MENIKKYFQKLRRFLRSHRRTRKKAVWQNAVIAVLLAVVCVISLKSYADSNTLEAAIKKYCENNFIDNAEICSIVTYEGKVLHSGQLCKDIVIRKHVGENEYYQYMLWAVQVNPLKWQITGGVYYNYNEPIKDEMDAANIITEKENVYDISTAGIPGISFTRLYGLEGQTSVYDLTEAITARVYERDGDSFVSVRFDVLGQSKVPHEDFFVSTQFFEVNMENNECRQEFQPCKVMELASDHDIVTKNLWISDDVLISAAKIISEAITSVQ